MSYDGAAREAPASLILKTGLPERAGARWNSGRYEVAFYTQIAAAMSARLVPRCIDAVWREDTNDWQLLLEDLTDTHFALATQAEFDVAKSNWGRLEQDGGRTTALLMLRGIARYKPLMR